MRRMVGLVFSSMRGSGWIRQIHLSPILSKQQGSTHQAIKFPRLGTAGILFASVGIGYSFAKSMQNERNFQTDLKMDSIGVDCSPITPLAYRLFFPLHSMKPEPQDQYEKVSHKFRWMNTGSALGIEVDPNQLMDNVETLAKKMTYQEFMLRAAKLLGRDEYGKKTIHHVILATDQEIRDDLYRHRFNPRSVSLNHKDWVWLDQKYSVVTFMWDEGIDAYRFHFHQGFVLLEAAENKSRFLTIPVDIKFINDEASPMNVSATDVYLKEIVEKFNEEQELIRTQVTYVY